jgi:hypothetical protein
LTHLAREEVQLVFGFLDWRSKLALARCNRTLRGDCDSSLAWQDSDGPSAFSPAGVIELNLARLTDEPTVERAATRSLAGRRGRVRLLHHHHPFVNDRCMRGGCRLPFELFQRMAASLPRLHGLGPLCGNRGFAEEEWILFFTVALELQRPLAELRVTAMDAFHTFSAVSPAMVSRVLDAALSAVHAPHLRMLTTPWTWNQFSLTPAESRALVQLPQLTQLECGAHLWLELTEAQPDGALFGQLRSLSLLCSRTRLGVLRVSLCSHALQHLRVLRLFNSLHEDRSEEDDQRHWSAILSALPRLETLALFLDSGNQIDEVLQLLSEATAPSLRTMQLPIVFDPHCTPSRGTVAQMLAQCPLLSVELSLAPQDHFVLHFGGAHGDMVEWVASWWRRALTRWQWSGLPRTRFTD